MLHDNRNDAIRKEFQVVDGKFWNKFEWVGLLIRRNIAIASVGKLQLLEQSSLSPRERD